MLLVRPSWVLYRELHQKADDISSIDSCSDIGGRKWVYVASITVYAILNFVSNPQDKVCSTLIEVRELLTLSIYQC